MSTALSGCTDATPETESPDGVPGEASLSAPAKEPVSSEEVEAAQPVPVVEPFRFEGTLGNLVGACAVVTCQFYGVGEWDVSRELDGVLAAELTLTWDTTTAPELGFGIATSCDGACEFADWAFGAPPLTIDLAGLDPDRTYTVVAWHPYRCEPVMCAGGTQVGVETEFLVEGTVTVV